MVSEVVADKVTVFPFQEALDEIDLSKYGTGIQRIHFIVVALPPDNTLHENEVIFDRRKKQLTLELNLSYPHVLNATASEVLSMAAKLFLVSIDMYTELKIQDFDINAFKSDMTKYFTSQGCLY